MCRKIAMVKSFLEKSVNFGSLIKVLTSFRKDLNFFFKLRMNIYTSILFSVSLILYIYTLYVSFTDPGTGNDRCVIYLFSSPWQCHKNQSYFRTHAYLARTPSTMRNINCAFALILISFILSSVINMVNSSSIS
jgi:hypothetical protein